MIPLEFVCYYSSGENRLPRFNSSDSSLTVDYITLDIPIFPPQIIQVVEVHSGAYSLSFDAVDMTLVEIRQHGVVIALRHPGETELRFEVGVFVPYSTLFVSSMHSFSFEGSACEALGCSLDVDGNFELLVNGESLISYRTPHQRRQVMTLPASFIHSGENNITLILTTITHQNVMFTLFPLKQKQSALLPGTLYSSSTSKVLSQHLIYS